MKIEKLNGQFAKIGSNSITVKDEAGKTAGIITGARELYARESCAIWQRVRAAVGDKATECINGKMRMIDRQPIYLSNINNPDPCADALEAAGFYVARYKKLA